MAKNISKTDRLIRLIIGCVLLWLLFLIHDDIVLSMALGLLGIYFLITAAIRICMVYQFLGIRPGKRKNKMY